MEDEMIYKEIYQNKNMWLTENEPLSCFTDGFRIESNNVGPVFRVFDPL